MTRARRVAWTTWSGLALDRAPLLCILSLATLLRLAALGDHNVWLDEAETVRFAEMSLRQILAEILAWEPHPPLYYFVMHFTIDVLGTSEFVIRFPSAVFSVLSVYFTYRIGDHLAGRRVGLIAALLMALAPFSIAYGQEARMYALLALTSAASLYYLLRWLERPSGTPIAYTLAAVVLVYTHIYGVFVLLAENLLVVVVLMFFDRENRWSRLGAWARCQLTILALAAPWLAILVRRTLELQATGFWIPEPTLYTLHGTLIAYAGGKVTFLLCALLILIGVLSATSYWKGRPDTLSQQRRSVVVLAAVLLSVVVVAPFLLSKVITPMYVDRYTIGAHLGFVLLVALGVDAIPRSVGRAVAVIVLSALSVKASFADGGLFADRAHHREAVAYLREHARANDVVLLCGNYHLAQPFRYYAKRQAFPNRVLTVESGAIETTAAAERLWWVRMTDEAVGCENADSALPRDRVVERRLEDFRGLELVLLTQRVASSSSSSATGR